MPQVKRLQFKTTIHAPVKAVWEAMLGAESFKKWTAAFMEGSYYEGSWEQGSKIYFLMPAGEGMVATIAENRKHEFISIKHLGMVNKGVEDLDSESVRAWAPAYENYTFRVLPEGTEVQVDQDVTPDFEQHMLDAWPKALQKLKALCESNRG